MLRVITVSHDNIDDEIDGQGRNRRIETKKTKKTKNTTDLLTDLDTKLVFATRMLISLVCVFTYAWLSSSWPPHESIETKDR